LQGRAEWAASVLVSGHAHDSDAGDLALRIEAEQNAGRIAAREYQLHFVECLIVYRALLNDFAADQRRPVFVEVVRHRLHRVIGQLGAIGSGILRAVDLTRLHLRKTLKRKGPHAVLRRHASRRRRVGAGRGGMADRKRSDQHEPADAAQPCGTFSGCRIGYLPHACASSERAWPKPPPSLLPAAATSASLY